jgi:hypothetical protein
VTGEVRKRDGDYPSTYRIAATEGEKQPLDLIAIRVPTKAILDLPPPSPSASPSSRTGRQHQQKRSP